MARKGATEVDLEEMQQASPIERRRIMLTFLFNGAITK